MSTREELAAFVKRIMSTLRAGSVDEGYGLYATLFDSSEFRAHRAADQRQVLRLMVFAKSPPPATEPVILAHQAAARCLEEIMRQGAENIDHEMMTQCRGLLGDSVTSSTFAARETSPGEDQERRSTAG